MPKAFANAEGMSSLFNNSGMNNNVSCGGVSSCGGYARSYRRPYRSFRRAGVRVPYVRRRGLYVPYRAKNYCKLVTGKTRKRETLAISRIRRYGEGAAAGARSIYERKMKSAASYLARISKALGESQEREQGSGLKRTRTEDFASVAGGGAMSAV